MICFHPVAIAYDDGRARLGQTRLVPCGRCPGCRVNRAEDWANRMMWESDFYPHTSFITLTYSPDKEPADMSVDKRTLQLFIKRLRKEMATPIKYFGCGEYGEHHGRPHYHAIVFGLHYATGKFLLQKCWPYGFVDATPFVRARARYVAGYILKEVDASIDLKGRTRPFALMSKKLGLGFALSNAERILNHEEITVNGKGVPVPRYFRKKLEVKELLDNPSSVDSYILHGKRVASRDFSNSAFPVLAKRAAIRDSVEQSRKQAAKDFETREQARRKDDNGL